MCYEFIACPMMSGLYNSREVADAMAKAVYRYHNKVGIRKEDSVWFDTPTVSRSSSMQMAADLPAVEVSAIEAELVSTQLNPGMQKMER